ncbi:MAG: glycosyltransferase family 4 protein [Geminicoccaceae bacterium]
MRVACVQSFPIDYCIDFVNAIAPTHDVTFLAADRHVKGLETFVDPRAELVSLSWPRHRSLANINLLRRMSQIVRSRDIDVVHFLGDDVSWLNFLPFMIGRRPIVITIHDATTHPGDHESLVLPRFAVEQFYQRGTRLIVHGESIRTALAKRSGRSPDVIDIVPHVAMHRYQEVAKRRGLEATPDQGVRRLLFFGRVMAYKGLPDLLAAARLTKQRTAPSLKLVVAGRGPALDDVRPELGADHVQLFDQFVPDELVAQLFLDTDLVVLPYLEASQSGILAIAAAFGKPVLVTDVGELGEIVRATGMGLVAPPSDPEALSAAISRFLTDPAFASELAEASRRAGSGDGLLSRRHVATRAEASYQKAIEAKALPTRRAG